MQLSDDQKKALEEQKAQCPFCKIVKGEIPSKKVFENDEFLIVLDINPATEGHMLVVPKEHYPILPFMPPEEQKKLYILTREAMKVARNGMITPGATMFVANGQAAGQNVNHFMIHVIPREMNDGLEALQPKPIELDQEEVQKLIEPLQKNLGIMMQRVTGKGKPDAAPMQKKPTTEEDLIKIIEMNKPLLDIVLQQPNEFKKLAGQHPQLKDLFADKDVDKIVETVLKKHGKEMPKEESAEEPVAEEQAPEETEPVPAGKQEEKEVEADFDELKSALAGHEPVGEEEVEVKEKEDKEEKKDEETDDKKEKKKDKDADLDNIAGLFT